MDLYNIKIVIANATEWIKIKEYEKEAKEGCLASCANLD